MTFGVNRGNDLSVAGFYPHRNLWQNEITRTGGLTRLGKNTELGGTSSSLLLTKNPYPSFGMPLGRKMEP
jgi:hypothetical protein